MLIFDIDYSIDLDDAFFLVNNELGLHPSWICKTDKGVHVGFVLRDKINYEWHDTIKLAKKIKVAATKKLKADERGSHRLNGWWRNPVTHEHYWDSSQLVSLRDFYHLLPQRSPTHRFKRDVVDRQKRTGDFQFRDGYRNNWLWYRAMQVTKGKEEYTDIENVYNLISSMQEYEADYNNVDPLPDDELHRIAGSVAKYNSLGKNWVSGGGEQTKKDVNDGIMGLARISGLSPEEYRNEVKRRQRLAAERTNEIRKVNMAKLSDHIKNVHEGRRQGTRRKILNCVLGIFSHEYKKKSGAWHYGKISKDTGVSTKTVARYIKQFEEEGILPTQN